MNLLHIPLSKSKKTFRPSAYKQNTQHYIKVHMWIKKHKPKPEKCEWCTRTQNIQYANLSFEYKFDVSDWACLCVVCRMRYDSGTNYRKMMNFEMSVIEFFVDNYTYCDARKVHIAAFRYKNAFKVMTLRYINGLTLKQISKEIERSSSRVRAIIIDTENRLARLHYKPYKNYVLLQNTA